MANILFLDAQTKNEEERITSFADELVSLIQDFRSWVNEHGIAFEDLWYADIFEYREHKLPKHIGRVRFSDEEGYYVEGTPGSKVNPYKRKKSLTERIRQTVQG